MQTHSADAYLESELADALAWALEQIEDDLSPDHQEALAHARAVLARARGEGVQS
jgi:hypothetical protein